MTQKEIIKNHLEHYKTITPLTAWQEYGVYRLSDVILKLRNAGMNIITIREKETNIFGDTVTFARYQLMEEQA